MEFVLREDLRPGLRTGEALLNRESKVLFHAGKGLSEKEYDSVVKYPVSGIYITNERTPYINELIVKGFNILTDEDKQICLAGHKGSHYISRKVVQKRTGKEYANVTYVHSMNVAELALQIGYILHLDMEELLELATSAVMHDIGKRFIPMEIISKPGKLSKAEFGQVKKHPELGYIYVKDNYPELSEGIIRGIYEHHEKLDGSGYPNGLKGEEIHPIAQIIAVSDIFDALTSRRAYHEAMDNDEALELMQNMNGLNSDVLLCLSESLEAQRIAG